MESSFDVVSVLLFAGAAQGILLAVALLTLPRGNRLANRVLAHLLMLFVVSITLHVFAQSGYMLKFPHLIRIEAPLAFLFGPLIYFYVGIMTKRGFSFGGWRLLHFLPFILCITILAPLYLQSADSKIQYLLRESDRPSLSTVTILWFMLFHSLFYTIASLNLLRIHKNRIRRSFSSLERINLNWLRLLLIIYTVDWSGLLLWKIFGGEITVESFIWLLISLAIYLIGYLGLRQPEIFSGDQASGGFRALPGKKYEKSTLKPEKAEEYLQALLCFMNAEKPYRNTDLNLQDLARTLAISHHHLSRIINERLHQNFFEFVNGYRIEEVKKSLRDPTQANINIARIGFDAGFNSISSFNSVFKKHTGMTPSQFRKNGT